jgi:tRNA(Arg) A34 adenosine deaminase TadA
MNPNRIESAQRASGGLVFAVSFSLPEWLRQESSRRTAALSRIEERMGFVINLARMNIQYKTGGPFAAAVFTIPDGKLISPGINLVTSANASILHAEMVALTLAQNSLGSWDLSAPDMPACELVASSEPCAMCFGALPWSGIKRLVCGARREDAAHAGFDEGEKPADWTGALVRRGIEVVRDVCRVEAAGAIDSYARSGGVIYNARRAAR